MLGVDFNWAYPFRIGEASFSIEGPRGNGRAPRTTKSGASRTRSSCSPRSRYDLGKAMSGAENRVLIGTELQVWRNKFGVEGAHEFLPQFLFVFGF